MKTQSFIHKLFNIYVVETSEIPTWTSFRYSLAFIGMIGFTFFYLLRINLSVAIVCMVKPPQSGTALGKTRKIPISNTVMPECDN